MNHVVRLIGAVMIACVGVQFQASLVFGQATWNGPVNGTGTFLTGPWTTANGSLAPGNSVTTQLALPNSTVLPISGNTTINNDATGLVLVNGGTPTAQNAFQFTNIAGQTSGYIITGNSFTVGTNGVATAFGSTNLGAAAFTSSMTQQIDNAIVVDTGTANWSINPHANTPSLTAATQGITFVFNGDISGTTNQIAKGGFGILRLNGNNTFTGPVNITSGTLVAGNANALGSNNTIIFSGGTLAVASGNPEITINKNISLAGNAGLGGFDFGANAFKINGTVGISAAAARTLTVSGLGTKTIMGDITGVNGTVNAITVQVTDNARLDLNGTTLGLRSISLGAGATLTLGSNSVVTIDGDQAGGGLSGFLGTAAGVRTINGGTINCDFEDIGANTGGTLLLGSKISGQVDINPGAVSNSITQFTNSQNNFTRMALRNATVSVSQIGNKADASSQLGTIQTIEANGASTVRTQLIYSGLGETTNRDISLFNASTTTIPGNASGFSVVNNGGNLVLTGAISGGGSWSNTNALTITTTAMTASGFLNFGLDGSGGGTVAGVISNGTVANLGLSVSKFGAGTWALTGANTYTGLTTVNAGTLLINGNNSAATGAVSVAANAILGGSGTVGGATTISGIHSPGNSPGIQTFANNLTYNAGASVNWELAEDTVANAPLVFDQVVVNGNLNFAGATALNLNFTAPGGVNWSDAFWNTDKTGAAGWLLYDVAGTTTGLSNLTVTATNWLDGSGNSFTAARPSAGFSVQQVGTDVYLNYSVTAVPEPSSIVLLCLTGAGGLAWRRRRS